MTSIQTLYGFLQSANFDILTFFFSMLLGSIGLIRGLFPTEKKELGLTIEGQLTNQPTFADRMSGLLKTLENSSKEVDSVLREIALVTQQRHEAAVALEKELAQLSQRESELKDRIEALKDVPIPVAEHFAKLTSSGEKRSARRDYILFAAGVVTSFVSSIVLKWLGYG